jgi:hypothetical protein
MENQLNQAAPVEGANVVVATNVENKESKSTIILARENGLMVGQVFSLAFGNVTRQEVVEAFAKAGATLPQVKTNSGKYKPAYEQVMPVLAHPLLSLSETEIYPNVRSESEFLGENDGLSFDTLKKYLVRGIDNGFEPVVSHSAENNGYTVIDGNRRSIALLVVLHEAIKSQKISKIQNEYLTVGYPVRYFKKSLNIAQQFGQQARFSLESTKVSPATILRQMSAQVKAGVNAAQLAAAMGIGSETLTQGSFGQYLTAARAMVKDTPAVFEGFVDSAFTFEGAKIFAKFLKSETHEDQESLIHEFAQLSDKEAKPADVETFLVQKGFIKEEQPAAPTQPTSGGGEKDKSEKQPTSGGSEKSKKITEMVQFLEKESGIDIEEVFLSLQSAYAMGGKAGSIFRAAMQTGEVSLLIEAMRNAPNDVVAKSEKILAKAKVESEKA